MKNSNIHQRTSYHFWETAIKRIEKVTILFYFNLCFLSKNFLFHFSFYSHHSPSDSWRLPDPTPCPLRPLLQGPHLLWLLWRDAVGPGPAGAQMWRLETWTSWCFIATSVYHSAYGQLYFWDNIHKSTKNISFNSYKLSIYSLTASYFTFTEWCHSDLHLILVIHFLAFSFSCLVFLFFRMWFKLSQTLCL